MHTKTSYHTKEKTKKAQQVLFKCFVAGKHLHLLFPLTEKLRHGTGRHGTGRLQKEKSELPHTRDPEFATPTARRADAERSTENTHKERKREHVKESTGNTAIKHMHFSLVPCTHAHRGRHLKFSVKKKKHSG